MSENGRTQGQADPIVDAVLAPGSPPLTQALVDRVCAFFEWILEVKLDLAHRILLRQEMVDSWTKGNAEEIADTVKLAASFAEVEQADPAMRAYMREAGQAETVQRLRADDNEVARAILEVYDAANAPLAPGDPPLTREMVDCYVDRLAFMAGIMRGDAAAVPVSDESRKAWLDHLVELYPHGSPEQRAELSGAPLAWRQLQAWWLQASGADLEQWRSNLANKVARAGARVTGSPDNSPPAAAPAAQPAAAPAPTQTATAEKPTTQEAHDAYLEKLRDRARGSELLNYEMQQTHESVMNMLHAMQWK